MVSKTPVLKSIRTRIFMLILAVLVPLAGFAFYDASQDKQRWVKVATLNLVTSTREAKNKVSDLINASEELLMGLSATDAVVGRNLFTCTRVLHNVAARFSKYTNFSVVNKDKFIVCSSGPLPRPKDVSTSPNIVQAFETKAFTVSPFKFGVLTGKPVLVFSHPLLDTFGEVAGTVNNGLSLMWLSEYLAGITQDHGQHMLVIDGQGVVMASHPANAFELGKSIKDTPLGRHVLDNASSPDSFIDQQGIEVLVAADQIPRIPGGAYVVSYMPLTSVLTETRRELFIQLGLLFSLAVVSLVIGWIGARILVLDPIDRLSMMAKRIKEGDLSARTGLDYNSGELGALAQTYDQMVDTLDARTSALRASESNYRELVESEEQLIHRFLPDTTEVFVNQALAEFIGCPAQELVGKRWIEFLSENDQDAMQRLLRMCTPTDSTFVYEHMMRDLNGDDRWLRWNNRAFFDDVGNLTHVQSVGFDLTDRKTVERNLEVAMMDARAANRAKSNFLANMSHELRTPLNSIIGFSEMMSSGVMGELPETYQEYTQFITSSGHHLLDIISDILDLSKIEAGMFGLDEGEVDMASEITEVIAMVRNQAEKVGNTFIEDLEAGTPLCLQGDRMRIKQILLNIISNANKFTENGTITISACHEADGVVVRIKDTGIGMTESEIKTALSPFGQVDGHHLNKRFEGTGLGLPLAVQLMEMHDGKLKLDSQSGEGTTVTLLFPAERSIEAADAS